MMNVHRSGRSSSPKTDYLSISRRILEEARAQHLQADARLPSVRVLAKRYGVDKAVLVQSFKHLADAGLCYAIPAKGTFLTQEPPVPAPESTTVCTVLNYTTYTKEDNPFYRLLYEGVAEEATTLQHNLLYLHNWRHKGALEKNEELAQFCEQLAGFVALGIYDDHDCLRLRNTGLPVVVVDTETTTLGLDCVMIDNQSIMRALCERVVAENPDRIFLVDIARAKNYDPSIVERRAVFEAVLASAGRPAGPEDLIYLGRCENLRLDLEPFRKALKRSGSRPTVVCMDEFVANQWLLELEKEAGQTGCRPVEAGEHFLLAYLGFLQPLYPSVARAPAFVGAVDFRELGRAGVRLLEDRIENGCGRAVRKSIPGKVIYRDGITVAG